MYKLVDFTTKKPVTPTNHIYCDGDSPWEVLMDLDAIKSRINRSFFLRAPAVLSKYFPFLPIKNFDRFVSMNEGSTPLVPSKRLGAELGIDLYFKQESHNPTGSFKDRGSAIELSVAQELGAEAITVASTGNMAASCSCYAAAAKIPCFVFVPEGTPASKLSQTISFGGRIVQVKGTYNDAAQLAEEVARKMNFYLAGDYAFRVEGQKTAAFELCDQFYPLMPAAVVVPIGCGTNIAGYAKGFSEYRQLGLIDSIPRLIGVQAAGASSVVNSFVKGMRTVDPLTELNTVASAIAVTKPLDGVKALDAIYSSEGCAVSVTDKEILEAQYLMSREEGLYVEASAATTLASIRKLVAAGEKFSGPVVLVLTGDGLKDPSPMLKMAIKPPTIYPSVKEFTSLYEGSYFSGQTVSINESSQLGGSSVLFSVMPTDKELEQCLMQNFGASFSGPQRLVIESLIEKFLRKGKHVTFLDLQDIIQETVASDDDQDPPLKVIDFDVLTGKDRPPEAKISVLLDGSIKSAAASGVGPVDAVINALKKACLDQLQFSLENFEVVIRSQGTDAAVVAEMKLKSAGATSNGKGTSPDVIQASIEAFEGAYNGLVKQVRLRSQ